METAIAAMHFRTYVICFWMTERNRSGSFEAQRNSKPLLNDHEKDAHLTLGNTMGHMVTSELAYEQQATRYT